jgi:hypothetical protein
LILYPERDAFESSNKSKHEYPQKRFKNRERQNLAMNGIAEKHFKYTATKTCKIKSENQMKGKVKTKTITKQYLPTVLTKSG